MFFVFFSVIVCVFCPCHGQKEDEAIKAQHHQEIVNSGFEGGAPSLREGDVDVVPEETFEPFSVDVIAY